MSKAQKTQLTFRVWYQGSNMPGYMPDEPPHPFPSEEAARESLAWDIGRDIDLLDESDETSYQHDCIAELERYRACVLSGDADNATIGNRHYFISEDTATTEELEALDVDDLTEFEPVLDEWVDIETLDALESADFDVDITSSQYRYSSEQGEDGWLDVKWYDDGRWNGRWFVGSRECGPWIVPALLIRADSWGSAYDIFLDESPTVPVDELHEAYGADDKDEFDRIVADARNGACEWPELSDEYSYQSNSSDTGIVYSGDMHLDSCNQASQCGQEYYQVRFKVRIAE